MNRLTILIFTLFCCALGAIEDDVYIESLAANIEKSGLLSNFAQSWKQHIESWHRNYERAINDTWWPNNTWPNATWPAHENATWPNNGTWPTPAAFNCNTTAPTQEWEHSINRLHPSHIDIVAAMGASMVAGTGAGATRLVETIMQYRGLAFPIGGDGTLNDTVTLPNILKEYNSRLRGWSRSIAPAWLEDLSSFNVAVPGATASDLDDQAKELIKRINQRSGARDQWKLITIFIGMNDLCEACDRRIGGRASSYGRQIRSSLDKLQRGLTRTVVNLVALPPMHQWYLQLHDDPVCWALHRYVCPCISDSNTDNIAGEYNAELDKLPGRYTRNDFVVVVQPFMSGFVRFPKVTINGTQRTDQSFFAPDCFHFSRRGHAAAARSLWDNMFQAVGEKSSTLDFSDGEITCPDPDCPYIRTGRYSGECSTTRSHHLSTLHDRLDNLTSEWWGWVRNHTLPPHPHHHWNVSENSTAYPIWTLKPWHRNMIRLAQIPSEVVSSYSNASAAWIAFGVILALAVVATATLGYIDFKKRRGQLYRGGERTPLLAGSNVEPIF